MKALFFATIFLLYSCSPKMASQSQQVMQPNNFKNDLEIATPIQPNPTHFLGDLIKNNFDNSAKIDVFVITNRQQNKDSFGCSNADFTNDLHNQTKYGICTVFAPNRRSVGEIYSNNGIINNSLKVMQAKSLNKQQFFEQLATSTPLVYVHGFNTKYEEAVLRAAQLAYDLKYQGPVLVFTWPAGAVGEGFDEIMLKKTYQINKINAVGSVNPFLEFMQEMQNRNIKANFIVHSMGNQIALTALEQLQQNSPNKIIQELFLNAPDYDANLFQKNTLKNIAEHTTLYCSNNDKALAASKIINGNHRLGECTKIADPDIDVINVTAVDNNLIGLGHSYFRSRPVLLDMHLALLGFKANQRIFIIKASNLEPEKFILRQ